MTLRLLLAYLFILSLFIPVEFYFYIGTIRLEAFRLVLILSTLVLIYRIDVIITRYYSVDFWVLFLTIIVGLSYFLNHSFNDFIEPTGIFFLEVAGSYFLAKSAINNSDNFERIYFFFLVLMLLFLPISLYEFVSGDRIIHRVAQMLTGQVGLSPDLNTGLYRRFGFTRATSVFVHPILYGVFAMILLPLAYVVFKNRYPKVFLVFFVFSFLNIFFTLSSAPLLGVFVQLGIAVYVLYSYYLKPSLRIFGFYILFGVLALVHTISNRGLIEIFISHFTLNPQTGFYRIEQWKLASDDILENPWFGIGLNDWTRPDWMMESIDSYWLLMALQHGFVGLFVIVVLTVSLLFLVLKRLDNFNGKNNTLKKQLKIAWFVSFSTLLIMAFTVDFFGKMHPFFFFFMGSIAWIVENKKN